MIQDKDLITKLEKKLREITALLSQPQFDETIGVLGGISGIAMFHYRHSEVILGKKYSAIGCKLISQSLERINDGFLEPTYCNGIAGLGWVLDHLKDSKIPALRFNPIAQVDEYLYDTMCFELNRSNFDFLHGALGYAVYFLQRYETVLDGDSKAKYGIYIKTFLEKIKFAGRRSDGKIFWISKTGDRHWIDLGLAHGLPSLIIFFSKVNSYKEFAVLANSLLMSSVRYLLSTKKVTEDEISLYPTAIPINTKWQNSRLAWCYGDLGIALSLWHASISLRDSQLLATSVAVFNHASNRKDLQENKVVDAGICHGAFGIAKIFLKMYQITKADEFKKATDYWMDIGLQMSIHPSGYAGFAECKLTEKGKTWSKRSDLICGVAGIGLVIMDYLYGKENGWDKCLLIA